MTNPMENLVREARERGQAGAENDWVSDALVLTLADALESHLATIEKVRAYADDRYRYGQMNRTVGSMRIASDIYSILG